MGLFRAVFTLLDHSCFLERPIFLGFPENVLCYFFIFLVSPACYLYWLLFLPLRLQYKPSFYFYYCPFSVHVLDSYQFLRVQHSILFTWFLNLIFHCFLNSETYTCTPHKCWVFSNGCPFDTQGQYVPKPIQHHLLFPSIDTWCSIASSCYQSQSRNS